MQNQTRPIITFAQLLATAKKQGFRGVKTEIVQLPTAENHFTAVMRATVTMLDDLGPMTFDGTGDASPVNVKPAMVNCLPRLAETRAIVRALKLAVGIGDVAAEELPDYEGDTDATPAPAQPVTVTTQRPVRAGACTHCMSSKGEAGPHHAPTCPNNTRATAGAR